MAIGRSIAGYRLVEAIGRGAQGEVWLAADARHPDVLRVIKLAAPNEAGSSRSRFRHEARLGRAVVHPNVVRVLDAGEADGQLYLVLELIDGPSWRSIIRTYLARRSFIPVAAALGMVADALRGLQALHDAVDADGVRLGFVHRDLAPKNLMVDRCGRSVVIDLGIARSTLRDERTATGALIGTPGYMSPEQVRGERVDGRSDVFAMGAVLFELLTLERLVPGASLVELVAATETDNYRPVTAVRSDVEPHIEAAIRRAVRLDPADRFASPGELAAALDAASVVEGRRQVTEIAAPLPATVPFSNPDRRDTFGAEPPPADVSAPTIFKQRLGYGVLFVTMVAVSAWTTDRLLGTPPPLPSGVAPLSPPRTPGPRAQPVATPRPEPHVTDAPAPPEALASPGSPQGPAPVKGPKPPNPSARVTRPPSSPAGPSHPAARTLRIRQPTSDEPSSATGAGPGRDALEPLVRRARRVVQTSTSSDVTRAAVDLVVRLNRLSAEAQRGRPIDLAAVRKALEALEQRSK